MSGLHIAPPASPAELEACAELMAASEPWLTLRRDRATCLRLIQDSGRETYVAHLGGQLAGVLVLNLQGAFVGYLQAICLAPAFRGQGLGSRLIAFTEDRIFRDHPNVFLCVSGFNHAARRLYERRGYTCIGELKDYVVPGQSEWLYRKTRGPLA
jgi:ribosomal protein S18 acetylase RimI-like enzyme